MPDAAQALWPNGPSSMLGNEELTRASMKPVAGGDEHKMIDNFRNEEGLFEPIKEDMKGRYKEYADKAAAMTKNMVDLYKSGDPAVRSVVRNWEVNQYARDIDSKDPEMQAKAAKAMNMYGSKETMTREAMWEAYMTHYGNLLNDAQEREDIPESAKPGLHEMGGFDRPNNPKNAMNMNRINAKLSAQYGRGKGL
jgi:hypothetical protein